MDHEYRKKILEQFDVDIASELIEFGKSLSRLEGDIFILMSRKFCCLYKLLLSIGIPPIKKTVVSDKLLYIKTDLFEGKIVTIIDDIVICGSTIWKAKDRLIDKKNGLKAKEVKFYIFCADEKYWVKKLVDPEYPIHVLSENKALAFCSSIVRALSIAPIPYSVEFPVFKEITITEEEWDLFAWSGGWIVKDLTSKIQEENNIAVFTVFPSADIEKKIIRIFGEKAYNLIEIHKIRIYAKLGNGKVTFTMLPMITIKPLSEESNNVLFNFIIKNLNFIGCSQDTLSRFNEEFDNPVVKLRFIQYITSLTLSSFFKHSICRALNKDLPYELFDFDIELLFGSNYVPLIKELISCFIVQAHIDYKRIKNIFKEINTLDEMNSVELDESEVDFHLKDRTKLSEVRDILVDYNDIFRNYYYKKELPEREKIREMAEQNDYDGIRASNRLEEGIAWNQIIIYYKKIVKSDIDRNSQRALSLLLDYNIDRGVCVPIIQYDKEKGIVYRSYRHGEDILFAEQEIALCGLAIEYAQKALKSDKIPNTFLEKLLVLFIKIGINKKIFEEQYGIRGQESIAYIDFYLQGAVAKFYRKKADSDKIPWLHEYLVEKGIIKEEKIKEHEVEKVIGYSFVVPKNNESPYTDTAQKAESVREATHFGNVIGELYRGFDNNGEKISLTSHDLIYLSTCDTPKNVSNALCAEIEIFLEQYNYFIPFIKKGISEANKRNLWNYKGFKALNSLHSKTDAWIKNKSDEVKKKGRDILKKINELDITDWNVYCDALGISDSKPEKERFDKFIIDFSRTGHRLLFYLDMFRAYPDANGMSKFIKFKNAAVELTKELYTKQEIIIKNEDDKELITEDEIKALDEILESYNNNWENFQETEFKSLIIKKLDFYKEEAVKILRAYKDVLGDYNFEKDRWNCDFMVFCVFEHTGTDDDQACKAKNEIIEIVKRMMERYKKASGNELYIKKDLLYDDNDMFVAFPKNEELNIKYINAYLNYLCKISSKYGVYYHIIICSGNEFKFNFRKNIKDINNQLQVILAKIYNAENRRNFGIPESGSNTFFLSENIIMMVNNDHVSDNFVPPGSKLIQHSTFTIQDDETNCKFYMYSLGNRND